jgi:hypothetical protein
MKIAMILAATAVVTLPATYAAAATVKPIPYEARVKLCNDATKNIYNGEGKYVALGACLSNTRPEAWTPEKKR